MKTTAAIDAYDWPELERVIVLSPHLDDAVLSASGLLSALEERVSRLVVTIACGNPIPRSIDKKGRHRRGFAPPGDRRREDIDAMHDIDCDFVHLGFADCVYRRSPTTGDLIYKSPRMKFVLSAAEDRSYVEELFLVLRRLVQNMGRVLVVAPLGIGFHVDHQICAQVALQLVPNADLLFYEDVPYVFDPTVGQGREDGPEAALARLGCVATHRLAVRYDVKAKVRHCNHYVSQLPALFSDPDRLQRELCQRTWEGGPAEFFWRANRIDPKP